MAAAQEERFSRHKNTSAFPIQAINFCIQEAGITFDQIDHVAYFEKPYLKFARVLIEHVHSFPFSFPAFLRSMPEWLDSRLSLPLLVDSEIGFSKRPHFLKHHLSHAASAFYPSPFSEAAILTADGVGEWATLSIGKGQDTKITIEKEIHYPDSLGLLYTTFTVFLGFDSHGGEGKTMALAGFGDPLRYKKAMAELLEIKADASFRLNQKYFAYRSGSKMWNRKFEALFGAPRAPGSSYEQRHYDLAAALQASIEEVLLKISRKLQQETGLKKLCLAGGVTLNCVANAKILEESGFEDIYVQPAAGDAGGSLGAALYVQHALLGKARSAPMPHAYLGPQFSEKEILKAIKARGFSNYTQLEEKNLVSETAKLIAANKVVGWFQGKMEFGPRALGARSILGNPRFAEMGDLINKKVKKRESFRPFAPMVLEERAGEYFHLKTSSPFMLLAPKIREEMKKEIPAAAHVDGSARVQTVDKKSHPRLRLLLEEFDRVAGVPVLLNTSFNRKGEPVVCTPSNALDCFLGSEMDALAIGDFLLVKP